MHPDRAPWAPAFPDVLILADELTVKRHPAYTAAKEGDAASAADLVADLVTPDWANALKKLIGNRQPILASIHAQESAGINAIPEALADLLALQLGLTTDETIVQVNVVSHTGAGGFARLARQALFEGDVQTGADYLIVDDFIGQGGTIANFRGHIAAGGGRPIGAVVLTGKPYSTQLALSAKQLNALRGKHGALEAWWTQRFGFDFSYLTESEARYLVNTKDADTIRSRIAEAQQEADGDPGQGDAQQP
jgi:hypothetical protein